MEHEFGAGIAINSYLVAFPLLSIVVNMSIDVQEIPLLAQLILRGDEQLRDVLQWVWIELREVCGE